MSHPLTPSAITTPHADGQQPTSARRRIVAQSLELFSGRGYNGVSMSEIARAAGITKAALYYHFVDKEELFLESVATKTTNMAAELQRIIASTDGLEALLHDIALYLLDDGLGEYRRLHVDLLTIVSEARRKESLQQVQDLLMTLAPRLREEQRMGKLRADLDVDATLPLFFAMVGGQIRRLASATPPHEATGSNEQLANLIVDLWLHGMSSHHSGE